MCAERHGSHRTHAGTHAHPVYSLSSELPPFIAMGSGRTTRCGSSKTGKSAWRPRKSRSSIHRVLAKAFFNTPYTTYAAFTCTISFSVFMIVPERSAARHAVRTRHLYAENDALEKLEEKRKQVAATQETSAAWKSRVTESAKKSAASGAPIGLRVFPWRSSSVQGDVMAFQ